ncbi:MAG: MATE family efflux transporter [Bacteroidales bacterium]|jgi:putative MATE family efflux protein|nr:MATE family efflux transporter [Bacteroidales bacterium]
MPQNKTIPVKNEEQTLLLGRENVGKLLKKFSLPAIAAMIASSMYNIVDSVMIGQGVGAMAIAGVAICFPFMNLAAAFGSLVGVGAATVFSIKLGEGDYKTARLVLGNVVVLNTIIGLAFTALTLPFLNPILRFFGASDATVGFAYDYMKWILICNVFTHIFMGLNGLLRAAGFPNLSMGLTMGSVLLNIPLTYIAIFVMGMGIEGAAIATTISQIAATLASVMVFVKRNKIVYFSKDVFHLRKQIVKDSCAIGMSPFLMHVAGCLVVIIINHAFQKHGGDFAIGAYGIINRVSFVFMMVCFGLMQGMQPIVSYNYGAKQYSRMWHAYKLTVIWATLILALACAVCEIFPAFIAGFFTTDSELISQCVTGFRYSMLAFPVIAFGMVTTNFFQSTNKPKKSIFLSLTRQFLFLIPLIIILPQYFGLLGVWLSLPISDFISTVLAFIFIKREKRIHYSSL